MVILVSTEHFADGDARAELAGSRRYDAYNKGFLESGTSEELWALLAPLLSREPPRSRGGRMLSGRASTTRPKR